MSRAWPQVSAAAVAVGLLLAGCGDAAKSSSAETGSDDTGQLPGDADGDGFASADDGGEDCDDDDATVFPGATEVWYDGVDQDCSGGSDYDADGDGSDSELYGGGDCDDEEFWVGPGSLELCGNGVDDDCDGDVDEAGCGQTVDAAEHLWVPLSTLPFLGVALSTDCDLDADGTLDVLASAPGDQRAEDPAEWVPGRILTLSSGDAFDPAGGLTVTRPSSPDAFGTDMDCGSDIDGDGYTDLVVSSFSENVSEKERELGRTVVLLGPLSGEVDASEPDVEVVGRLEHPYWHNVGHAVQADDVTGDDEVDLLVARGDFYKPWSYDAVDLHEAGSFAILRSVVSQETWWGYDEAVLIEGALLGEIGTGDLDGDGIADVLSTTQLDEDRVEECGAVYSGVDIAAAAAGDYLTADVAQVVLDCVTDFEGDSVVWAVVGDQDLDGDGHADAFLGHRRGWSAFAGGPELSGRAEPDARLQASFGETGAGIRDAAFDRDEDERLRWAVSLFGSPEAPAYTREGTAFRGRVAVFQDWGWHEQAFEDAAGWIAWDEDDRGLDARGISTRDVRFSHEAGTTRLWFADPVWTVTGSATGRVVVFDIETLVGP